MLGSLGWNPELMQVRWQAFDLDGKIKRVHSVAPRLPPAPSPCHDGGDGFRSEQRLGELTNVHHHPWKPHKGACPTDTGLIQCKKSSVTSFLHNQQV